MDLEVVWTEAASADLDDATGYVRARDPAAAEKFTKTILDHTDIPATFPFIGPTYPRGANGGNREIVQGSHRIFDRVLPEKRLVEILAVRHGAGQPPPIEGS